MGDYHGWTTVGKSQEEEDEASKSRFGLTEVDGSRACEVGCLHYTSTREDRPIYLYAYALHLYIP